MRLRMAPLTTLLNGLARARRAGLGFDEAWEAATVEALAVSCDSADWSVVLGTTRASWEAAYRGKPATAAERAVGLLGWDVELIERTDKCRRCGELIAPERARRGRTRYCSTSCRRRFHSERERVAA